MHSYKDKKGGGGATHEQELTPDQTWDPGEKLIEYCLDKTVTSLVASISSDTTGRDGNPRS